MIQDLHSFSRLITEVFKSFPNHQEVFFNRLYENNMDFHQLIFQYEYALKTHDQNTVVKAIYRKAVDIRASLDFLQKAELVRADFDFFIRNNDKIISILKKEIEFEGVEVSYSKIN